MAINFPNSPANGQIFTTSTSIGSITYAYNSAAGAWRISTTSSNYANLSINEIVASAGQTTFPVPGGYIIGQLEVFANGIQLSTADYSAPDSVNVVVAQPRIAGDVMRFTSLNSLWGVTNANAFQVSEVTASSNLQTVFTVNYNTGTTLVSLNGVELMNADYTANNGTSITLSSGVGVQAGHILRVVSFNNVNLSGALSLGGGTVNGNVNINGTLRLNNQSLASLSSALSIALGS
jgi:hypothetical protein